MDRGVLGERMMKKFLYIFTFINILFQIVYMTFGMYRQDELGVLNYIFCVFRPEYMVVSGIISFIVLCCLLAVTIKNIKDIRISILNFIVIALNIEYILFYIKMLQVQ